MTTANLTDAQVHEYETAITNALNGSSDFRMSGCYRQEKLREFGLIVDEIRSLGYDWQFTTENEVRVFKGKVLSAVSEPITNGEFWKRHREISETIA